MYNYSTTCMKTTTETLIGVSSHLIEVRHIGMVMQFLNTDGYWMVIIINEIFIAQIWVKVRQMWYSSLILVPEIEMS